MYTLSLSKIGISKFILFGNNLLLKNENLELFFNDKIIGKTDFHSNLTYCSGKCYISENGQFKIYHIQENKLEEVKKDAGFVFLRDDVLLTTYKESDIYYSGVITSDLSSLLFKTRADKYYLSLSYFNYNSIYTVNDFNKNIVCLDTKEDSIIWKFHLSSLGTYMDGALEKEYKLQKFCGNYCNKLILVLENSDVLLLDANTGKLLQHFKDVYFNYYSTPKAEGSNLYWSLVGKHFTEIDVDSQVVTRKLNLEAELLRHNAQDPKNTFYVFIKNIVVHKELIYFYTSDNQLGIFSPQEEKIIWFHKMDIGKPSGNFFTDIQVNDTNIYVLDYSGTLHIFEKEKDISIT